MKGCLQIQDFLWGIHWHLSKTREYPGVNRKLHYLKEESKQTPMDWHKLLEERLLRLIAFAASHVPYYRDRFRRLGFNPNYFDSLQQIESVPVLTKDLIRGHLDDLVADKANRSKILENATGGSTGVPLRFYQDLQYQTIALAIDSYVREWWGIRPHDRTALVWGADREFHELSLKERIYEWRQRTRAVNAFRMNEEILLRFCQILQRWRPPYLMGYSTALEALAKCARKNGISDLTFKAIRSTAEMLWPRQRLLIEKTFNSPVYNFYGSREINNIAAECPEEKRLHLISAWRYVEIVDENGHRVPDGELGYIAVTDLSNYSMPFIRYRNEDIGKIAKDPCPCGRPSPVMDKVLGRSADLIRTPQGDIIHGEYFTHLFYGRNDIRQIQIHQTDLDHIIVRYVPVDEPPLEYMEEVVQTIRERMGNGVGIEVEVCEKIPIPPSGKHRFTISDVGQM